MEMWNYAYFRGVNANRDCGTIGFFSLDPLNVDHEFLTVALSHLADLLSFVVATNNLEEEILVIWSYSFS